MYKVPRVVYLVTEVAGLSRWCPGQYLWVQTSLGVCHSSSCWVLRPCILAEAAGDMHCLLFSLVSLPACCPPRMWHKQPLLLQFSFRGTTW